VHLLSDCSDADDADPVRVKTIEIVGSPSRCELPQRNKNKHRPPLFLAVSPGSGWPVFRWFSTRLLHLASRQIDL
jgi:hypothetical protein